MATSYAAALALRCVLTACRDEGEGGAEAEKPSRDAVETSTAPAAVDEELRHELLAMLERDQAERMGTGEGTSLETDQDRTNRLEEIVDEHGRPGFDLVERDGEEAARAIAQHSDLDPESRSRRSSCCLRVGRLNPRARSSVAATEDQTVLIAAGFGGTARTRIL